MKALSIRQPWASLIAEGHKTMELRMWKTDYRGMVAIHASKKFDERALKRLKIIHAHIKLFTWDKIDYPAGQIIAVGRLREIVTFKNLEHYGYYNPEHLCPPEYFGVVPYGWRFEMVEKLDTPIPCRGQLGLWGAVEI